MSPARTRLIAAAVTVAASAALLTGCGDKYLEPFKDAPRSGTVNNQPADIIEMPDGFSNLTTKCDHGNRLYVGYHGDNHYASITVVAADPTCANGRDAR